MNEKSVTRASGHARVHAGAVFPGDLSWRSEISLPYRLADRELSPFQGGASRHERDLATDLGLCFSVQDVLLEGTDRTGRTCHSSQPLLRYSHRLSVSRGRPTRAAYGEHARRRAVDERHGGTV